MKANELRIGNIVSIYKPEYQEKKNSSDGVFQSVLYIKNQIGICRSGLLECYKPDELYGVPLTERILRDWCGFLDAKRVSGLTRYGIDLVIVYNGDIYESRTGLQIKFLHQLQNFVFAVAGVEMDIKISVKN